jgi:hypothetical protein
MAILP